jgi:HSP20 family protein
MISFAQPRALNGLQTHIDRSFAAPHSPAAHFGTWLRPVDIPDEGDQFVLHVDLPGVDPKTVEITCNESVLTIRASRDQPRREARATARRIERIAGEFQRRFRLPELADTQNIKAKSINGVLEVAIPKLAREPPRRIAVEAG